MPRQRLSLKARALGWLAQREHSRAELRRKLLRVARAELVLRAQAVTSAAADDSSDLPHGSVSPKTSRPDPSEADGACSDPEGCVDRLLDWLQAHRYLSEERFVESRVHARAARYGNLRIRQELAQHGVAVDESTRQHLQDTEFQRAREVWQRKFGAAATEPRERARHMRFLAQRGFSASTIRRVVQGGEDMLDEDETP